MWNPDAERSMSRRAFVAAELDRLQLAPETGNEQLAAQRRRERMALANEYLLAQDQRTQFERLKL